ncbi:MAG: hypothetical protein GW809_04590 [Bacteroidetes bacterium]|jgi:hypothetical protein|nr:hypothetical protein [Bacteroidota bacterium]
MKQYYYNNFRKQLLDGFIDSVQYVLNSPINKQFPENIRGILINKHISDLSSDFLKKFDFFQSNFKKQGEQFMTYEEYTIFVKSVTDEVRYIFLDDF